MSIYNLLFSMFDELESQRRFLLDESVQSAFLRQIRVDRPCGKKRDVIRDQQPGGPQQSQSAGKAKPTEGSNTSTRRARKSRRLSRGTARRGHLETFYLPDLMTPPPPLSNSSTVFSSKFLFFFFVYTPHRFTPFH